jgi:hypothetical protein
LTFVSVLDGTNQAPALSPVDAAERANASNLSGLRLSPSNSALPLSPFDSFSIFPLAQ